MLPYKIPNIVLVLLWFAGLIPYIFIAHLHRYSGTVAEIISDCSLSYFTAFPFWFIIEYFQKRERKHQVAKNQRYFLDSFTKEFNRLMNQFKNGPETKVEPPYSYFHEFDDILIHRCVIYWGKGPLKPDGKQASSSVEMVRHFGKTVERYYSTLTHYQASFSTQFNEQLEYVMDELTLWTTIERPTLYNDNHVNVAMAVLRNEVLELENIYRKENKVGPALPDPNNLPEHPSIGENGRWSLCKYPHPPERSSPPIPS